MLRPGIRVASPAAIRLRMNMRSKPEQTQSERDARPMGVNEEARRQLNRAARKREGNPPRAEYNRPGRSQGAKGTRGMRDSLKSTRASGASSRQRRF